MRRAWVPGIAALAAGLAWATSAHSNSCLTQLSGGSGYSLALTTDGGLWAWGWNDSGQLGNGTKVDSSVPVQVTGLAGVAAVSASLSSVDSARAMGTDGRVWTWGDNLWGQLGIGTNGPGTGSDVPVLVAGLPPVIAIGGGADHTLALASDGTVYAWGRNTYGQLGDGTLVDSSVPIPVISGPADPIPPDQGNTLRATKLGGDVLADFAAAPASLWRLYRDGDKTTLGTTRLVPDVTNPSYLDPGAIASSPSLSFYRLSGLSACFRTPGP